MHQDPWDSWVERLRQELDSVESRLAEGQDPQWSEPVPPEGPVPPRLHEQLRELTSRLETALERAHLRREELHGRLTALPRSRPRTRTESCSALGGSLDVIG